MGRKAKNHVDYDEFTSTNDRMRDQVTTGDLFTDYSLRRTQKTIPLPVPAGVEPLIQPPPGAFNSPTPQLDWVLPRPHSDLPLFDGGHELAEMDDCELEALGLGYLRTQRGKRSEGEAPLKKQKTQSVR